MSCDPVGTYSASTWYPAMLTASGVFRSSEAGIHEEQRVWGTSAQKAQLQEDGGLWELLSIACLAEYVWPAR
eukprot:1626551-Amphidinium_carterae.1